MKNIDKKDKKRLLRKQQATVFFYRICYSLHKPWKFIFVPPILLAFLALWRYKDNFVPVAKQPILTALYAYFSEVFIVLLCITALIVVSKVLITPFNAKRYEDCLLKLGLIAYDGIPPTLISSQKIPGTKLKKLTFYSLGVGREMWEGHRTEIEDVLNVHIVDGIKYGDGNRNIVVLTAGAGVSAGRREVLFDDEF